MKRDSVYFMIFNNLSGRYLATIDDEYLSFGSATAAEEYIEKRGINPEHFRIVRG